MLCANIQKIFLKGLILVNDNLAIEFTSHISDCVHGFIPITDAERKIINSDIFRRLQDIKQLSVVNWVFPGSEHTRYAHSLGVMHIADRMFLQLAKTSEYSFTSIERKIVRLAGLLHDIGHYPLSHLCETPYKKNLEFIDEHDFVKHNINIFYERLYSETDISKTNKDTIAEGYMKKSNGLHHENIGNKIVLNNEYIRKIIVNECGENAPKIISDMIIGNVEDENAKDISLLVQILHSELDADGIDYLMRDSYYSGTGFGHFELNQLVSSMCVAEYNGFKILCINEKGITSADQYLINKFFSFKQIVFNRHVIILEWMIEQVVIWMKEKYKYFPKGLEISDWVESNTTKNEYLEFNDYMFWGKIRKLLESNEEATCPHFIIDFVKAIIKHREISYLEEYDKTTITSCTKDFVKNIESIFNKEYFEKEKIIPLFSCKRLTKQIGIEEFNSKLNDIILEQGKETTDKEFALTKRLMEGICVYNKTNQDLHLLCDDGRSLIKEMKDISYIACRAYDLYKTEKDT